MTTISLEELGKRAAELLESGEPVIVTQGGDYIAVIYPNRDLNEIPMEDRRKRFLELSHKIGEQIGPDVTEEEIARDFAEHKKRSRGR